ncbi:MAG: DUF4157 domain-containing protein [Deltaproteobacteria bacterium]|nr:DUF4157 domain-containing protein [Deltaproteobacteria bacterium]
MHAKSTPRREVAPSPEPAPVLRRATAAFGYGAGRVASSDVFLSAAPEQRASFDHAVLALQRLVQRLEDKGADRGAARLDPASSGGRAQATAGVTGGSGQGIPFRARMEQSFGTDFGAVRAHFGTPARAACEALGAEAYTLGSDVAFRSAAPPESLVAHELTHVVQQRGGAGGVATKGRDVGSAEAEAESVAAAVASGRPATSALGGGAGAPGAAAPASARLAEATPDVDTSSASSAVLARHTVAGGETLGSIAQAYYGAPREYRAIATANHIGDPNVVEVGTPLSIPVLGREAEVAATDPATTAPGPAPAPETMDAVAAPDPLAAVLDQAGELATGVMDAAWDAVEALGAAAADLGELLFGDETETEAIAPAVVEELVEVAPNEASEAHPEVDAGPVSETPAQADGPIDPQNHQTRDTFVASTVPEIAETTALIDALYRHFPKDDALVVGGYLDDNQQFWKVNFHWEWMLRYIDQAMGLSPSDADVATLESIRDTLLTNPPDPATGYAADQSMTLADASTSETVIARWSMMKTEKARLTSVWASSGIPERSSDPDSFHLAAAPVAKPGTSKHGTGKALDIKGDNGRIAEIARGLGASLVFDEKSHVHVEFLDGVSP